MFSYETGPREVSDEVDLGVLNEGIEAVKTAEGNKDFSEEIKVIEEAVESETRNGPLSLQKLIDRLSATYSRNRTKLALAVSLLTFLVGGSYKTGSAGDNESIKGQERMGRMAIEVDESIETEKARYDFWQIAKIKFGTDPKTGKSTFINTLLPGEKGYVYDLGLVSPPYEVEGYKYVGYEDMSAGVTVYWYEESGVKVSSKKSTNRVK